MAPVLHGMLGLPPRFYNSQKMCPLHWIRREE